MKRVVITGLGTINPLGHTIDTFWANILDGKSAAAPIGRFNTDLFRTKFACELDRSLLSSRLSKDELKRADPYTQYGLYASSQAIEDSEIELDKINPFDLGVIWGTGQGGLTTIEEELEKFHLQSKKPHFHPLFIPKMLGSITAGQIAMKFGMKGIVYSNHAACASANAAMLDALNYIKTDQAKVILVGASDAPVTEATMAGFNALRALSTNNQNPKSASCPFDSQRDGFVVAEGGGALLLEEFEHARKRGAHIYGELKAASVTNDAYHLTANQPDGKTASEAIIRALKMAQLNYDAIDYINPHATSTKHGDAAEAQVLHNLWSTSNKTIKMSATKSMTGHHMGASGIIESIICLMTLNHQIIPPTINTNQVDIVLPKSIELIQSESIDQKVRYCLNNSFGFGGHNANSIFSKV